MKMDRFETPRRENVQSLTHYVIRAFDVSAHEVRKLCRGETAGPANATVYILRTSRELRQTGDGQVSCHFHQHENCCTGIFQSSREISNFVNFFIALC